MFLEQLFKGTPTRAILHLLISYLSVLSSIIVHIREQLKKEYKAPLIWWSKAIIYIKNYYYCYYYRVCFTNVKLLYKKKINEPWCTQFIKFCCNIVKSFPIDPGINDNLNRSSIEFLERQLYFITKTSRNYFSINQNTNSNNEQSVSREKLTDLWLNRRKKAINIKNNGKFPKVEQFSIFVELKNNAIHH